MKKSLLSILALSALAISAQEKVKIQLPEQKNYELTDKVYNHKGMPGNNVRNRDNSSAWYEFYSAFGTNADFSTLDRSLYWVAPDTNGFSTTATAGVKNRSHIHYIGSCFDPKDTTFAGVNTIFTKFQKYSIDSIQFWQTYQRNLDSINVGGTWKQVVDTVYIQYFVAPNVSFNTYSSTAEPAPKYIGMPNPDSYNPANRMNKTFNKMDTIFLTAELADSTDGTSVFFRRITIPVSGLTSGSNTSGTGVTGNVSAFGFTFRPMVRAALNDTFSLNGVVDKNAIYNKRNRYGTFIRLPKNVQYEAKSPYRINNTFVTHSELANGVTNANGWKGYFPGDFFGTNGVFLDYKIFVSTTNLGTKSAGQVKNVSVYPNPATAGSSAIINYSLDKTSNVTVSVSDLNGRILKSFSLENRQVGKQSYEIETAGLTKGMYIVNIIAGNDKVASKLCIQ